MTTQTITTKLTSPEATQHIAARLAERLSAGDTLLFTGDIGAGKTHFCRALIQAALGYAEDVPSPTFTLVQVYEVHQSEIWHADLYRLSNPDEVVELGLAEAFDTAICLVEWPDRLAELAPENALSIFLSMTAEPGERDMVLSWSDPKWAERLIGILDG